MDKKEEIRGKFQVKTFFRDYYFLGSFRDKFKIDSK